MEPARKRIDYIDFLKMVGMTGIMLAHVNPPPWLHVLRCCDVPLMTIVSAMLAEQSYQRGVEGRSSPLAYILKRARRLVLPTWFFLIIYFAIYFLTGGKPQPPSYYLASFLMTRYGIGYVWVILVYLYCAVMVPLFHHMKVQRISPIWIVLAYLLYEAAYYFQLGTESKFLLSTVYYIVPYGLLTYLGYNYHDMRPKTRLWIALGSCGLCLLLALVYWRIYGAFQSPNTVKYPPRIYFLSYGVACTFALLLFCGKHHFRIYEHPAVKYISTHSMWIYLWHILIISVYDALSLPSHWLIKLLIVYAGAVLITFIVNKALDLIAKRIGEKRIFKYLR